jgi:carbamoyltransferase
MRPSIGFGGSIHDFATCLLTEDDDIVAVEDERLNRIRYALGEPDPCRKSLDYCLDSRGLGRSDIHGYYANDMLQGLLGVEGAIDWLNHHHTHALSAFFTGPFTEAAILVVDGAGSVAETANSGRGRHSRETTTWALGEGNQLSTIGKVVGTKAGPPGTNDASALMSNSLGDFYRAITEAVGFGFLQAGKTMGLAPYGDDRFADRLRTAIELLPRGQFTVDMSGRAGVLHLLAGIRRGPLDEDFETNAAIAAAGQLVLEEILLHVLEEVWRRTECPNLCLAGGVALNCVFNGKIAERTPFANVHVIYAPGDSGTAIGAAVQGRLDAGVGPAPFRIRGGPYLGRTHAVTSDFELGAVLSEEKLYREVASLLHQGKVVAWYRSGAEFGPRALGNRSLLADPTRAGMRTHLNRIKSREQFRPFAPVVLEESWSDFFTATNTSPYMQFSYPFRADAGRAVPAVCHVDGSARVQTVTDEQNPALAGLLREFTRQGGPPMLLNTSLNLRGAPIVETPAQAVDALATSGIDALVVDDRLITR